MKSLLNRSLFRNFSTYLLKNARVVNSDLSFTSDVLIQNGKIAAVSSNLSHKSAEVIDCTGKMVIPGGIDTHTHMQLPFMGTNAKDDFDTGSKAAIAGGTTSFIDFVIPSKGARLTDAYQTWRGWADPKVNCDYSLHAAITDWTEDTPSDMKRMVENGITSFKFFMAYNNVLRLDDVSMFKAFELAKQLGTLCVVHAENGDIIEHNTKKLLDLGITGPEGHYLSRKESVEAEAVHRVITIAENTNVPLYIVHLMSKDAAEEVMRARNKGLMVYGQTLAATLGTDGTQLWNQDWDIASRYVMSPCLSPDPKTKTQIMKYLNSGIIDVVSTDNCTFCTEQKQLGRQGFNKIPNGVNGVEDRLSVVWTKGVKQGYLSENQFVEKTSTNAAQIFGMYPNKGVIREGADADVVIWDPNFKRIISAKTHHHQIEYNVFEGMEAFGKATHTFSNGNLVWDGKSFLNQQKGKFVQRKPFGFPYRRHTAWTNLNNPLNFKVDRSGTKKTNAATSQVEKLKAQLSQLKQENADLSNKLSTQKVEEDKFFDKKQLIDSYDALQKNLPPKIFESVRKILYGPKADEITLRPETVNRANKLDVEVKSFKINCEKQQTVAPRLVKVAAIQNKIVVSASSPVAEQKKALEDRIKDIIELAALEKSNVVCLQQLWTAPFFLCTREKYPWVQFSEPFDGQSTQLLQQLAKKHNMVIVSSILERQQKGTVQNTTVVVDNHGNILGRQEKGHIPRVGDFNESTYYIEGESGHPVFTTDFGKIGINICYGRHHPLHWMGFGLNGAEIVFNPSATVDGLSEPLWGIEARNAAIANHYFTVGINRVGTEVFPNEFTSGDTKKAHNDFGHFYGSTYVAAPDGSRTPALSRTRDGVLITELDLNMCQQIKDKWGFTMTGRHSLYADLLTRFSGPSFAPEEVSLKKPQK